jgi:hypothetical protein
MEICECGHRRYDHSYRGCAYQHDYRLGEDGKWHYTACNRFTESGGSDGIPAH